MPAGMGHYGEMAFLDLVYDRGQHSIMCWNFRRIVSDEY